jgi:5'-AMP-activated protein kinase regulatory gamma subunit
VRTSYDVLPLSFRLIILDNDLLIKKSVPILIQNSMVTPSSCLAEYAQTLTDM